MPKNSLPMNGLYLVFPGRDERRRQVQSWLGRRQLRYVEAAATRYPPFADHSRSTRTSKAPRLYGGRPGFALPNWPYMPCCWSWTLGGGLARAGRIWQPSAGPHWPPAGFADLRASSSWPCSTCRSLYHTFVIEQRFGFNRTTPRLFLPTPLKQPSCCSACSAAPLAAAALWLMHLPAPCGGCMSGCSGSASRLFMIWAYPPLIAPLFNVLAARRTLRSEPASRPAATDAVSAAAGFS